MNRGIWVPLILVLIACLVSLSGCQDAKDATRLPDFKENTSLTTTQRVAVFSLVRKALALYPDMEKALHFAPESGLPEFCDREFFVTIFHEGSPQITGVGAQGCAQERILRAVANLTQQPNFRKFYMLNLESSAIKIDLMTYRSELDFDQPIEKIRVEPGVEGLALQKGEQMYFQLPSDYIHFGWEPINRKPKMRELRLEIQLAHLCRQSNLRKSAYKRVPIYEFRTTSYLQYRPDLLPIPLYRGTILKKNFNSADIARAAAASGDWLINNIEPTGRFTYNFNPTTGERNKFIQYNVVRHAGSVYSLMHLYNQSLEPRYLERGAASMDFLKRHLKQPLLEPGLMAVRHPILGISELGSAALTLMAVCELPEAQFKQIGRDTSTKLARFLLKMQKDNGDFHTIYMLKLLGHSRSEPALYAPGEALLALVRYYKKYPNLEWLEAARNAAERQIDYFETTGVPDHWTVQGLSELYMIDPEVRYAGAAFDMADLLLKSQHQKHRYADYVGGFSNSTPPRSAPAASRTEALIAASKLARYFGRDSKKYDDAIRLAARFLMWNQYRKDNSYFLGLVENVEGAIRGGLVDQNIRMDYCQHAIVALVGAYKIMTQGSEIPAAPPPMMAP